MTRPNAPGLIAVLGCAGIALAFLLGLPAVAESATYLVLVVAGIVAVALAAALRLCAGRADGWVLGVTAATSGLVGQSLNSLVGLPAAQELRGAPGLLGLLAICCEVTVLVLAVRRMRAARIPAGAKLRG